MKPNKLEWECPLCGRSVTVTDRNGTPLHTLVDAARGMHEALACRAASPHRALLEALTRIETKLDAYNAREAK